MPPANNSLDPKVFERSRMSFGDHLEELRTRVIRALIGVVVATAICCWLGDHIIEILATPYCVAMENLGFNAQLVQLNPTEAFVEYFKICLKFGLVLSAPWVLFQLWRFVATGLYPSEQRVIRYFAPTSILLFVVGAGFMVAVVLSGLMKFLIGISMWFPLPSTGNFLYKWYQSAESVHAPASQPVLPMEVPVLGADPESPSDGQIWFNRANRRLNVHDDGETYYLRLQKQSSQQFVQPFFSVSEYLGFVVNLALAFGLGFQIPIVVVFLIAMRVLEARQLAGARKYVILGISILAAIITPTPDVGTMLLLAVPMVVLFEIGLIIGRIIVQRQAAE